MEPKKMSCGLWDSSTKFTRLPVTLEHLKQIFCITVIFSVSELASVICYVLDSGQSIATLPDSRCLGWKFQSSASFSNSALKFLNNIGSNRLAPASSTQVSCILGGLSVLLFLSRLCFRPPRKLQSFLAGLFGAPVGALATVQAWLQGVVTGRIGRFGWCALSQRSCLLLLVKFPQFRDFRVLAILATFVTVQGRILHSCKCKLHAMAAGPGHLLLLELWWQWSSIGVWLGGRKSGALVLWSVLLPLDHCNPTSVGLI